MSRIIPAAEGAQRAEDRPSAMSSDTLFTLSIEEAGGTMRATASGELDMFSEPQLVTAFAAALEETTATASVLDLRQLGFMDSSGLRGLLRCRENAEAKAIDFCLAIADGPVSRLLDVAGVKDWFAYG